MGLFHNLLLLGTKPQNDLEAALLEFLKGRRELPDFIAVLKHARVWMLAKTPLAEGRPPGEGLATPIMDGADGRPAFCVFTHPQRLEPYRKRLPEYPYAIEMDFAALVAATPPGFGMLFNAGTLFSTEVLPEGVDELR